jgi:hypothetical protein
MKKRSLYRTTLACALALSAFAAAANQTQDFGYGRIAVSADVKGAQLTQERASSEFRISFDTPGRYDKSRGWSNGVLLFCSATTNTIFVNGAGHFEFRLTEFEKNMDAAITLATDSHQIETATRQSIVTHTDGFGVWAGTDGIGMNMIVDALAAKETVYFMISEDKSPIKAVALDMLGVDGHNALSAFRKGCKNFWNAGTQ